MVLKRDVYGLKKQITVVVLISLCFLAYFNSLYNDFVVDDAGILQTPLIARSLHNLFAGKLATFTFSINYLIGKNHPFIYHLTNLFIHSGVVVLAYFF